MSPDTGVQSYKELKYAKQIKYVPLPRGLEAKVRRGRNLGPHSNGGEEIWDPLNLEHLCPKTKSLNSP